LEENNVYLDKANTINRLDECNLNIFSLKRFGKTKIGLFFRITKGFYRQ